MKRTKYISILTLIIIMGVGSCELPDNQDPKGASEVSADALFSNGLIAFVDQVNSISVNLNITRMFAQYTAQITYVDEGNFNFTDRRIPDAYFDEFYRDVLMDLAAAKKILNDLTNPINPEQIANQKATIDILEVYIYQCLVDAFGNVPYSEALMGLENPAPVYDDAQTIYLDLLTRINNDINTMDADFDGFGENDFLFNGDVSAWITFANSLKLRIAMRIADVPALQARSQSEAESAIEDGVISSHEQSALFIYSGTTPYTNSIYEEMEEGGRKDYVPANALVNFMNNTLDPRRPFYFSMVDTSTVEDVEKLAYVGGNPGDILNKWAQLSHFSDAMFTPKFPVTIMDLAEVEFLVAEAAARGYTVTGDAELHFKNAVVASIESWGGETSDTTGFISQAGVAYDPANWRRSIGLQKWVALYNRGIEGWAEVRKFDIDDWTVGPLVRPAESNLESNPSRMPYPYTEDDLNGENKAAAAQAIGGDEATTRIFWDVD